MGLFYIRDLGVVARAEEGGIEPAEAGGASEEGQLLVGEVGRAHGTHRSFGEESLFVGAVEIFRVLEITVGSVGVGESALDVVVAELNERLHRGDGGVLEALVRSGLVYHRGESLRVGLGNVA